MKVNGVDIRKYRARLVTVDVQPPTIQNNYEWPAGSVMPVELDTQVNAGHLALTIFLRGKNRDRILRAASELMENFKQSCILELDRYEGKYRGFMTSSDYEKLEVRNKYFVNLEFDGYFYDNEIESVFDGVTSGVIQAKGTREAPCILEITAKTTLTDYEIIGFGGEKIVIESLQAGKTVVIDGKKGIATMDGENAFPVLDMWKFPRLGPGKNNLAFSSSSAKVVVRYAPMWI